MFTRVSLECNSIVSLVFTQPPRKPWLRGWVHSCFDSWAVLDQILINNYGLDISEVRIDEDEARVNYNRIESNSNFFSRIKIKHEIFNEKIEFKQYF